MDGATVRLVNAGHAARARGRPGLRVTPGQRDRAAAALARRLRGGRGRRRRGGRRSTSRSRRARSSTGTAAGRPSRARSSWRPGRSVARPAGAHRTDGAAAARVLRGGRAPPALHARGRGALRHPAGALAADPAAGGGARARAAAAHVARGRADRGGRGPARPRRGGAGRGRAPRGRTWTATPASRAASCGSRRPRPTRRGCRRRSRTSTATTRASRSGCGRARRPRSSRWSQAGAVDVAVLALDRGAGGRRRSTRWRTSRCAWRCRVDDELAGTTVVAGRAARAAVHPRRAGHRAARDGDGRGAGGRLQPAAAVRGRRPGDGALPRAGRAGDQPRAGELARAAGAGRRRGGSARSAAPPAVSCSRRPRGPHRPAGSCTSACSSSDSRRLRGREPTSVWTGCAVAGRA